MSDIPSAELPLSAERTPSYTLFSQRAINVATFLGGIMAGTLLLGVNYHKLGKKALRNQAFLGGLLVTLLMTWMMFQIPDAIIDKIPSVAFSGINVLIAHLAGTKLLSKRLERHYSSGGQKTTNWATAGLTVIGLTITLSSALLYLPMIKPFDFEGEKTKYGIAKHEIYHSPDVPEDYIEALGSALTEAEYFTEDYAMTVQITKEADLYEVSLPFTRAYWRDPDVLGFLYPFEASLAETFAAPVELFVVDEDFSSVFRENIEKLHPRLVTPAE